jgi:hypothetical protein
MRERPKNRSDKLPSKGKKRDKKPLSPLPHEVLDEVEADFAALDDFCKQQIDINDLSFDDWESLHRSLDVQVPIWVDSGAIAQSPSITVKFTRRILSSTENGILKEAAEIRLEIPVQTRHGDKIVLVGLGDRQDQSHGDLIITLHLRKPAKSR